MYKYEEMKEKLFCDDGQRTFLRIRDSIKTQLALAGAVRMEEVIANAGGGDSWTLLACVDRLVELGEIREIPQLEARGQHRIFVTTRM